MGDIHKVCWGHQGRVLPSTKTESTWGNRLDDNIQTLLIGFIFLLLTKMMN